MAKSRLIMIVDDEKVIRDVLSSFLEKKGHQTVALPDGQSAISYAKHKKPALVLLDIKMPGLNGIETCSRLRQVSPFTPKPGIIIITGYDSRENIEKSYSSGAIDVIRKPLDMEDVNNRISTWFDLSMFEDELMRVLVYAEKIKGDKKKTI